MKKEKLHMNNKMEQAIEVLNSGGIIIFPTDTAFGVGCRIDKKEAVDRLFQIRNRPMTQALPILVSNVEQALAYYNSPSDIVRRLMKTYWPGALTIVDTCKKELIYSPIRGGKDTVGIRWPNHPTAQALIEAVGVPIVGPSANFHGKPTPFTFDSLDPEFIKLVDFVVSGVCKDASPSTVVDCTTDPYTIIRQGAVIL
jgi:L-threonylcarbamoyladenylate synthase